MRWMYGALAWLACLVVINGCRSNASETVVLSKPIQEHLCHTELPGYPGCECPPYCVLPSTARIVVTFTGRTYLGADGNPMISPWLTAHSYGGYTEPFARRPDNGGVLDSTLTFSVEVDTNGVAVPGIPLHLTIDAADDTGRGSDAAFGHYHTSGTTPPKPTGSLSDTVPRTPATAPFRSTVKYSASQYAEPIKLIVWSPAVDDTLRKQWTVGVPGLTHMSGTYVTLVGEITPHPHSHYVLPTMMSALNALAAKWNGAYHTNLLLNDMSLQYGGKFDLDVRWRSDTAKQGYCKPHCEHRLGRSADIDGFSPLDTVPYHYVITEWKILNAGNEYPEIGKAHLRYMGQP